MHNQVLLLGSIEVEQLKMVQIYKIHQRIMKKGRDINLRKKIVNPSHRFSQL